MEEDLWAQDRRLKPGRGSRFTKLQELLDGVDRAADEAEGVLGCQVVVLAFHELASVDRDVVDDLEFYVRERGLQKGMDVCIVLHTSGGDADAAYHIGVRLQRLVEGGRLIVAVPRLAKSAGILMACAGDDDMCNADHGAGARGSTGVHIKHGTLRFGEDSEGLP
jgi:ClpP class serine protease